MKFSLPTERKRVNERLECVKFGIPEKKLYLWCEKLCARRLSMTSKEVISSLTKDVEQLMQLHKAASEEVTALRAKNEEQGAKIRQLQSQLKDLKAELSQHSLRDALGGAVANKAAAKAHISRILREVDSCIAMVSRRIE